MSTKGSQKFNRTIFSKVCYEMDEQIVDLFLFYLSQRYMIDVISPNHNVGTLMVHIGNHSL